jgi:hypothetical protein
MQEQLGHKDVRTTQIYTHVLQRGANGVVSPLNELLDGLRSCRPSQPFRDPSGTNLSSGARASATLIFIAPFELQSNG